MSLNFVPLASEDEQMQAVRLVLQELDLSQYADTFEAKGYTSLDHILRMNNEELEELADNTTLWGNELQVFVNRLHQIRRGLGIQRATTPTMTPGVAVPMIPAGATMSVPPRPPPPPLNTGLKETYKTPNEVRLASLDHSANKVGMQGASGLPTEWRSL